MARTFSATLKNDQMQVRSTLKSLMSDLAGLDVTEDYLGTVEIILAEVLNNVIEHAYAEQPSDSTVDIACSWTGSGLDFCVTDEGKPMPDGKAIPGRAANLDVPEEDLPEGGFGWFLIQTLAQNVHYRREHPRNVLTFHVPATAET